MIEIIHKETGLECEYPPKKKSIKLTFINKKFGKLFQTHLKSLDLPTQTVIAFQLEMVLEDTFITIGYNFIYYKKGNLLGKNQKLHPPRGKSLDYYIQRLLRYLWALGVDENSEMIEIIRKETGLQIVYPPEPAPERIKILQDR